MARSDLLRQLFAAYSRGDDTAFRHTADEIISDERRKQHRLLASELERALDRDVRPGANDPLTLRPLPKARDDRALVRFSKPERQLGDLVLPPGPAEVLAEVVEENRGRALLASHGLHPRQRLLFVGASGTGKSASAHAVADELSLPVATVSMAALTSSYLGETARNVESVIRFAESVPCVLLFDELDAVTGERSGPSDHAEMRRVVATVLQLFEEMHGESVLIATSNHPSLIDSAMWRRFHEVVSFQPLDRAEAERLIQLKLRAVPHSFSARHWAERLADLSPAEIEMVCYDALRRRALAGIDVLSEEVMAAAVVRLESRTSALAVLLREPHS